MKGQRKSSCPFFQKLLERKSSQVERDGAGSTKEPPVKGRLLGLVQRPLARTPGLCLGNHLGSPSKVPFPAVLLPWFWNSFLPGLLGREQHLGAGISAAAWGSPRLRLRGCFFPQKEAEDPSPLPIHHHHGQSHYSLVLKEVLIYNGDFFLMKM